MCDIVSSSRSHNDSCPHHKLSTPSITDQRRKSLKKYLTNKTKNKVINTQNKVNNKPIKPVKQRPTLVNLDLTDMSSSPVKNKLLSKVSSSDCILRPYSTKNTLRKKGFKVIHIEMLYII